MRSPTRITPTLLATAVLGVALTAAIPASAAAPVTANGAPAPTTAPVHPVSYSFFLSDSNQHAFGGGSDGILNITSLTITNFSSAIQAVHINQVSTSGAGCSGSITSEGSAPSVTVFVPADQTIQLTFPTPLQIAHLSGVSCIALAVTSNLNGSSVDVLINGLFTYKDGS